MVMTAGARCTCRDAKRLGLNALRTWAFSDGPAQWNAIQPEWNVLNETILSEVRYMPAMGRAFLLLTAMCSMQCSRQHDPLVDFTAGQSVLH
jgi:hypothetical protein